MTWNKADWQRHQRRQFQNQHGYSLTSHYGTGGLREAVLLRDGFRCVRCGMTDAEHKAKWGRPITIDHKDKNRKHNTLDNLQTLCLRCHGSKDLIPQLRQQKVPLCQSQIIGMRAAGMTYQFIAECLGFSIGAIYKWERKWANEGRRSTT